MKKLLSSITLICVYAPAYASDFTVLFVLLFTIFISMLLTITAIFSVISVANKKYVEKDPSTVVAISVLLMFIGFASILSESSHMGDGDLLFSILGILVPGIIAILPPIVQYKNINQ